MAVELNIDTLFESAQQADREGRVEAALAGYNQVLARAPTHVGALYQKAMLAFQANRLEESLTLLQDARAARPDDAEINMSLGLVLLLAERTEEALGPLEQASAIAPLWQQPHLKQGLAHLALGRREQMQECFQCALMAEPGLRAAIADESQLAAFRDEIRVALELVGEREWAIASAALGSECGRPSDHGSLSHRAGISHRVRS